MMWMRKTTLTVDLTVDIFFVPCYQKKNNEKVVSCYVLQCAYDCCVCVLYEIRFSLALFWIGCRIILCSTKPEKNRIYYYLFIAIYWIITHFINESIFLHSIGYKFNNYYLGLNSIMVCIVNLIRRFRIFWFDSNIFFKSKKKPFHIMAYTRAVIVRKTKRKTISMLWFLIIFFVNLRL